MTVKPNAQILWTIPLMLLTTVFCPFVYGKTIYVYAEATRANDGSSWPNAYWCLQDALAAARSGDEIRVAQGIYKPDQQAVGKRRLGPQIVASGDRTASFELRSGVAIRGGYAGFGEPDPDARDIRLYETILSGDLNSDDGPGFANNAENSYHVVTGSGTDTTAMLDGFTVTGGNANDTYGYGGGMDNRLGTPTVTNCTFSRNCATRGGGMANRECSTALANCAFSGNSARWGGGMYNTNSGNAQMANCIFSGNAAEDGGAMVITKSSEATLRNCTLTGNRASGGPAGGIACAAAWPTVVNTILWDNSPNEIDLWESSITVIYSDVQGGWRGIGNINADPMFANPRNGDYHLKSRAGRWSPHTQVWVQDDVTSPCIDAGDPSSPVAFEPFPNGGIINMGAYGGTAEASKSPSGLHAKYSGGNGTATDPYQLATAADLIALGEDPNDYGKHFILIADIDLDPNLPGGRVFDKAVIAPDTDPKNDDFQGTPFRGVFDGNSHAISHLTITGGSCLGLFGQLGEELSSVGEVENLGMVDVNVAGSGGHVGGLVGCNSDGASVANCHSAGAVSGKYGVGGLVGGNRGAVTQCYSTGVVTGMYCIGGLVGQNASIWSMPRVAQCCSTGAVSGKSEVGGLVGWNEGAVADCYSTGSVSGEAWVGGLVGSNDDGLVTRCYSIGVVSGRELVGGLVMDHWGATIDCFWDIQTSGQAMSAGGTGKTTAEMRTAKTFLDAGWDFVGEIKNGTEDIWWILEGKDYPKLWWEAVKK